LKTADATAKLPELLHEALKMAESNFDEPGRAYRILSFPMHSRAVLQTQLRSQCIQLLCTAMACNTVRQRTQLCRMCCDFR
jgi:hypothetical protein